MLIYNKIFINQNLVRNMKRFYFIISSLSYFIVVNFVFAGLQFGADSLLKNIDLLRDKSYAICINKSSRLADGQLLIDALIAANNPPVYIFTPEHGFDLEKGAGQKVDDGNYGNVPILSLYGKTKIPPDSVMEQIDLLIYDLPDIGVRYFTYISTLKYLVDACHRHKIPLWILDRPNPLGDIVEGPLLDLSFKSFVGIWPIPIRYGLTSGELVMMGIGEGWLPDIKVQIIPFKGISRKSDFTSWDIAWRAPSPNLPDYETLKAYVGQCLWEGSIISEGRGTVKPFIRFGFPDSTIWDAGLETDSLLLRKIVFTPLSISAAPYPKFKNEKCYGYEIVGSIPSIGMLNISIEWMSRIFKVMELEPEVFFIRPVKKIFIDQLYGSDSLRTYISSGSSTLKLEVKYQKEAADFKRRSANYWLYP